MIFAIGGGVSMYYTQPYAERRVTQPAPEVVLYAYLPVWRNLLLRPGLRVNYSWNNNESPQSLKIKEKDFRYFAELAAVYNWILLPSFSVGLGIDYHITHFSTKVPIYVPKDNVSSSDSLPAMYVQAGLGFPLIHGWFMIEPYIRYSIVKNETTHGLGYGIEATLEIF